MHGEQPPFEVSMSRVVLHIGANKTGSTTLQRRLFATHDRLCYRGEDGPGFAGHRPLLEALVDEDDLYVPMADLDAVFSEMRADAAGRTCVYSNEDIARSPVPTACADRLARLLPEAMVVLVVRDQRTAIPSWYVNHGAYLKNVPRRYWRRFVGFDEWMEHCIAFPRLSPLRGFDYAALAELYAARFERVEVLLYEELARSPEAYAARWGDILGLPTEDVRAALDGPRERTRHTRRAFRWHRLSDGMPRVGRLPAGVVDRWDDFLAGGRPMRDWMSPEWTDRIASMYADSNTRLATRFDVPLAAHGYALTSGGHP